MLETITKKIYIDYPARASRFVPLIGAAACDSVYLTAWPLVALIAPLLALAFGFSEGAFHWTNANIWDGRILASPPGLVFMQMLPLLIVAVAVASLSVGLGLLLVLGYALGDIFVAGVHFWGHWHHHPMVWSLLHITVPQLITYFVFFLLVVQPALISRVLAVSLPRLSISRGSSAALFAAFCAAVQGLMVYAWTFMAPMTVRPYWLWHSVRSSPVTVGYFTDVVNPLLPLIACGFVLARALMVAVANQNPQCQRNAEALAEKLHVPEPRPRANATLLTWASTFGSAILLTLLLSGLFTKLWPQSVLVFALILAILVLRSIVLPTLPPWRVWTTVAKRIPLLARWAVMGIGGYYIGRGILALPGQSVHLNEAAGSFGAEISAVVVSLAFAACLFPVDQPGTRDSITKTSLNLRPAIQAAGLILVAFVVFHPQFALASCVASQCCFTNNWLAAAYVLSWIGVAGIFIFFASDILAAMRIYSGMEQAIDVVKTVGNVISFEDKNPGFEAGMEDLTKEDLRAAARKFAGLTGETFIGLITPGLKGPLRELLEKEGEYFVGHALESRIDGFFDNIQIGSPGEMASKYLWTIDHRGVNIAPASTPFATPSGAIVDTNISQKAYIGGEAWFGPDNTVHLNTGSSRFSGAGASPEQVETAAGFWQHLGYTSSFAAAGSSYGPTITASSAPTKFWELESIARAAPDVMQTVASQKPEWTQYNDLHDKFSNLVSRQDRASLDQRLPDDFVAQVLNRLEIPLYAGADGRISTWQISSSDQPISATEVFKRYGGMFLENVLEHGSELAV